MKITKETILLTLILLFLGYIIFTTNSIKTDVKSYRDKIDSIQVQVDSAKNVNKVIDTKIEKVGEKVVEINKEIHHIDNNITIVKENTNEKINNVDNFGFNELELFFANRYQ